MSGGREGIRTLDLSVANAALSQLSYAPNARVPLFPNIARVEETDNSVRRTMVWPFTGSRFISVSIVCPYRR